MNNWLKKYQQGGNIYSPANETSLQNINMYNPFQITNPDMSLSEGMRPDPWAINNPNINNNIQSVNQNNIEQNSSSNFGNPNWDYIANSTMVGSGLDFLSQRNKNSRQNAVKRFNTQQQDPLNTLMRNPNTSAQDQAGLGYYKMGGWLSKYQEGGEIEDDEEYLFGLDEIEEPSEVPEVQYSKRKNLQAQYSLEDQQNQMRQMQQEAFFSSLINTDPESNTVNNSYTPSSTSTPTSSNTSDVLSGIFRNEGARTGQPTNLNSSAVGRGQMIKSTREAMYKKLGFSNLSEAEKKYRTDPVFETQVINAYKDELSQRIPSSIVGKERDYRIAKGWYTGNPNYPDNQVPHPEAGNRLTAGEYARRAVRSYQQGGIIEDPMGQWNHPGEITRIPSNEITMEGVLEPLVGISNTGDIKYMHPGKNYNFNGDNVTEFPLDKSNWLKNYKTK